MLNLWRFFFFTIFMATTTVASAYTISGKVYGGSTVMAYARLDLYDAATSLQVSSVASDVDGNFQMTGVGDGEYTVYVTTPLGSLYRSTWVGPPSFVVSGADISRDITLTEPTLTLSGIVRTQAGVGISNIRVCTSSTPTAKCVQSGGDGAYSIAGLDVGTYNLSVYPYGTTNIASPLGGFSITNIVGALSINADTIQDITIPLVTLSGKTTDTTGTVAVGGVRVNLPSRTWTVGSTSYSIGDQILTSDSSGGYSAVLLPYNNYGANLTPPSTSYVATAITGVDASTSKTVNLKLNPAYSISGAVKSPKGLGLANIRICAFPLNSYTDSKCSVSNSNGVYNIVGLDLGTYKLTSYKYGTTNIPTPEGFSISPVVSSIQVNGNMAQDIVIPLVTLSGKVLDRNGLPIAKATVTMASRSWTVNSVYSYVGTQTTTTDSAGFYSFPLLPYTSYALDITPPVGSVFASGSVSPLGISADTEQSFNLPKTIPEYKLEIIFAGTGEGSVTSAPVGISCLTVPCSWYFDQNTAVSLFPTPDSVSFFSEWGGICTGKGECNVTMDSDKLISATFTTSVKAMIGATGYGSLNEAYLAAVEGEQIRVLQTSLQEDLVLSRQVNVTIRGGYATDFSTQTGIPSEVQGALVVGQGSLTVEGLVIK